MSANARIGQLALTALRDFYRAELFGEFIPFMDRYIVDRELGGFCCHADRDGTRLSGEKVTWYLGRGVWVYSFLYSHFGRNPDFLAIARGSLDFLLKVRPASPEIRWPKRFTREGQPLTPPDPQIYGDMFIAEGLTAYSAATGDTGWLRLAKEILFECVRFYDSPEYDTGIGQTYLGPDAPPIPGARVLGVSMVLLRLTTQMLELGLDAEIQALSDRAIATILGPHLHPEFDLLNEILAYDFTRPTNEFGQLFYVGHALETMWMLMDEARRRKDDELWATAARLFRCHVEVAWDDVFGGVFANLMDGERNLWGLEKLLWEQVEVMVGCLCLVERSGDAWASETFERMFVYLRDRFRLERHGLPLYLFTADRRATFIPHADRIENYHLPRYLMLSLLASERMLAKPAGQ